MRFFGRFMSGLALFLIANAASGSAEAQFVSQAERDSVTERGQPGIDPQGMTLGSFRAYPSLGLSAGYDDNLYNRRTPKLDDGIVTIRPAFDLASQWDRHSLRIDANADLDRHFDVTSEDTDQYGVDVNGRYDIATNYKLNVTGTYARKIEPRGTAGDVFTAGGPNAYFQKAVGLDFRAQPGHALFELSGNTARYDYVDNFGANGRIDESNRAYVSYSGRAKLGYQVGPGVYAFASGDLSAARYPNDPNSGRESNGYAVGGGIQFGLGPLMGGEIGVNYLADDFKSPLYSDIHGLGYNASLFYNPTTLLSLQLQAARTLERAPLIQVAGIDQSAATLTANYELLRRLRVTGGFQFINSSFRGIDRTENTFVETLGTRYNINRFVDLTSSFNFRQQNATTLDRNYTGNSFKVGVLARY
jgi:hypothetical protein